MPCNFPDDEIYTFLSLVKETNSFKLIDGRGRVQNKPVFDNLNELCLTPVCGPSDCVTQASSKFTLRKRTTLYFYRTDNSKQIRMNCQVELPIAWKMVRIDMALDSI